MPIIRDDAIVLARLDYSENSQILVLFTQQHGKVRAIGKGIKRGTKSRFAVGIDLLEAGAAVLSSRSERTESLALLTEWKQTRSWSGIREKLTRMHAAQYIAEITASLTEDWDPAARLYDAMIRALEGLCGSDAVLAEVISFQHVLLEEIGALPRFDACVLCGRDGAITYFSSFEGGFICKHCEPPQVEKRAVSAPTVRLLQHFAMGQAFAPLGASIGDQAEEGPRDHGANVDKTRDPLTGPFSLLNYHISHLMGKQPVMAVQLVPTRVQRRAD